MDSGAAELEISCKSAERKRIKAVLDGRRKGDAMRTAQICSSSGSGSTDGKVYDTDRDREAVLAPPSGSGGSRVGIDRSEDTVSDMSLQYNLPPVGLFCSVQATVLEELRCGAFQRFVGTPEGQRRLALLSVQSPLALL